MKIDFILVTPFRIEACFTDGSTHQYDIVEYPHAGMVYMDGKTGQWPISPTNLYRLLSYDERVEMVELRVKAYYNRLNSLDKPVVAKRSSKPLFNKIEYGE